MYEKDKQGIITKSNILKEKRQKKIATSLAIVNKYQISIQANRSKKSKIFKYNLNTSAKNNIKAAHIR